VTLFSHTFNSFLTHIQLFGGRGNGDFQQYAHLFFAVLHGTSAIRRPSSPRQVPAASPPPENVFGIFGGARNGGKKNDIKNKNARGGNNNKKGGQKGSTDIATDAGKPTFAQNFFKVMPPHVLPASWVLYGFVQDIEEHRHELVGYLITSIIYLQLAKYIQGKTEKPKLVGSNGFVYFMDMIACIVWNEEPLAMVLYLSIVAFLMLCLGKEKTHQLLNVTKSKSE